MAERVALTLDQDPKHAVCYSTKQIFSKLRDHEPESEYLAPSGDYSPGSKFITRAQEHGFPPAIFRLPNRHANEA